MTMTSYSNKYNNTGEYRIDEIQIDQEEKGINRDRERGEGDKEMGQNRKGGGDRASKCCLKIVKQK